MFMATSGRWTRVLEDIQRRGIREIVNLGDHLWGSLAPARTADRLIALNLPSIRGNQDRELLEASAPHISTDFTKSELSAEHYDWLRSHPPTLRIGDLLLCHGSPTSDTEYLLDEVTPQGIRLRIPPPDLGAPVVACGHTHLPRVIHNGVQLIVNPGSVGLPAYSHDEPFAHKMETGSPHARYAILDGERVDLIAIRYDWQAASNAARRNGRPAWAHALLTGRAL